MEALRAALVGFGFIAENGHLPSYLDSMRSGGPFTVAAVADVSAARRELARRLIPGVRVYPDHGSLLAAEARRLDYVDIATPPSHHAPIAHAALRHGLHVLCEKPLTVSRDEALGLLTHARRAARVVFPCHNYKHAPVIRSVRRALDQGAIGDVRVVTLQTFRPTHARGVDEWRPDWRRERAIAGGGIGMDHGSHTFYLAFDWMGAYPRSITASATSLGDWDTEDNLSCTVGFPGGRIASAHLTWTAGMRRVLYTLHGTDGAIRVEDDDVEIVTRASSRGGAVEWRREKARQSSDWMDASHATWFRPVLETFAGAIARGEHVSNEAEDALRCVELIDAAYRSAALASREVVLGDDRVVPILRRAAPPLTPAAPIAHAASTKR
jgi:predicted dehydrogenase